MLATFIPICYSFLSGNGLDYRKLPVTSAQNSVSVVSFDKYKVFHTTKYHFYHTGGTFKIGISRCKRRHHSDVYKGVLLAAIAIIASND